MYPGLDLSSSALDIVLSITSSFVSSIARQEFRSGDLIGRKKLNLGDFFRKTIMGRHYAAFLMAVRPMGEGMGRTNFDISPYTQSAGSSKSEGWTISAQIIMLFQDNSCT